MDIQVTLSDKEAEHLQRLSSEWGIDIDETIRSIMRTHLPASRPLSFSPGRKLSYEEALEIVLKCGWNEEGAYIQLRLGQDPGAPAMLRLLSALRLLWHHYREKNAIPHPVCQVAAMILFFGNEAESNLRASSSELRSGVLEGLMDIRIGAYNLLSGANADPNVVCRPDLGEKPC